ncbi:DUF3422 domain-containing protein [Pseudochelatococcus contaminans]|uniref:Putative membrane-anchored protein n=1 Tax=Pseudochelatococcus contaminans TaxID=1538103 RepID=A0A7W5Z252_9HYPH|nr:DUF3422 domain-containing protein [Pseudochelatococcus contaminans]MBB3808703.1 putative membrane-anchored protein [Pseudochelatococcus contaminans]
MAEAPYPHEHPHRDAALAEIHARPVDLIDAEARVRRLVFTVDPQSGAMTKTIARFLAFAADLDVSPNEAGARRYVFTTPLRQVTWEFHTEFVTITWRAARHDDTNWPDDIGLDALGEAQLVGAIRVDLIDQDSIPEHLLPGFSLPSLCFISVESGGAQVATDFVPDADKFIRIEFAAGSLSPLRRAIVLRRLLEMETYRTMALLALPLARDVTPGLRALEIELSALIESLSDAETTDQVRQKLDGLVTLSVQAGQISEKLGYRFAAAHAYGTILRSRLEKLRETTLGRGSSLSSFIGNRVEPALSTCAAIERRLEALSTKIARTVSLLDVRIGLDMQIQNKTVLETIAETAKSQFRLQHTVEGLSTIAITYYAIGILGYAVSAPIEVLNWDKTLVMSAAAVPMLIVVWASMRWIRNRKH